MKRHLYTALRTARLRWAPRIGLVGEHAEPSKAPQWCATSSWHGRGSSSTSGWVTPIGHRVQVRPYSAAPAHGGGKFLGEEVEEDEMDRRIKKMEKKRKSRDVRCAQRALMDYLYVTRKICFSDAENMSKRSPTFLSKLLEKVKYAMKEPKEGEGELMYKSNDKKREMRDHRVTRALRRLLNFYPINEFEPFFESIGLRPDEYHSLLPRDLMFLADDEMLLQNYKILCNYGIVRTKIGRIYRDAREVFGFGEGVLASKLKALENLGFSKTSVIKVVLSTPVVLVRDPNVELEILQWLHDIGIQRDWITQFLSARKSYNWRKMVEVPEFFSELGFTNAGIGKLLRQNPGFLLDGSGKKLFTAVVIMLKMGFGKKQLFDLFLDFPKVPIEKFARNLLKGILFLAEIGVNDEDIKKFVVCNGSMLGSVPVKKPTTIFRNLNVGKACLYKMIMEDPYRLLNFTIGSKLSELPSLYTQQASFEEKAKFLKGIGFVEGSEDMKKALKTCRGTIDELQDRYDFLVKAGLDRIDVVNMIKTAPRILNQKVHALEYKISFLVNDTEYPLSALVGFPRYLIFNLDRTKSRVRMYNWLLERGVCTPQLALCSVLNVSEKQFIKYFVKKHPGGLEAWENLKREVASTKNMSCTSDD